MDLQQLKYFQKVAELEHMTRAAEQLNISQPALSKAISQIEKEVGVALFDRVGRQIQLNRYGQLFLEKTQPMTRIFDSVKQEISDLVTPFSGTIAVGFTHSMGTQLLSKIIKSYHQQFPNVHFEFIQRNSLHLLQDLNAGKCDVCIIPHTKTTIDLQWRELWREEVFVIVPATHPLAKYDEISVKELANETFVSIKEGNSLRQIQTQLFEEASIEPEIIFEGEEFHTVASFVEAGFGVGLLPDMQRLDGYQVKRLRIADAICQRKIGIATMKGKYIPEVAQKFEQFIIEQLSRV